MPWLRGEYGTLLVFLSACASEPVAPLGSAGAGGGGSTTIVDTGSGPEGPWPCTASVAIDLPAVPVRGTVTGDTVHGTLCAGGIAALAQDAKNPDTGELMTVLQFIGPGGTSPRFEFDTPSGVDEANLEGRIGIGSGDPQPGTFTNETSCGSFFFVGGPSSGNPVFIFGADAASNCESASILKLGSWSLTVDSLTPVPQDETGTAYITHGHLLLTLQQSSPRETADLDLEF